MPRPTTLTPLHGIVLHRRTVAARLQRTYRSAVAAGLAVVLVGAVGAAAVVDDDAAGTARADLASLRLEAAAAPDNSITAPEVADWALAPVEVDVELEKEDIRHLREVQVAARNAERQALEQREAEQEQAEQEQAGQQQDEAADGSEPEAESEPAPMTASQGGERGSLAGMVNNYRGQNGLSGLSRDGTLDQVAQSWAEWMAGNQVLQHNPNYASQIGGGWSRSGENIVRNTGAQSWGAGEITSWMFNWWQNSAPHRANILNTAYTHVGVGYAMGSGGPYAVLLFGGR
ncbi:CAP domain-containing protein [Georgenia sp. MJ170]|uniref:CAP domain-containing protein n=1 Tax=Georgenia sunbinii TaxID=3117728 RepID=UPI002F26D457